MPGRIIENHETEHKMDVEPEPYVPPSNQHLSVSSSSSRPLDGFYGKSSSSSKRDTRLTERGKLNEAISEEIKKKDDFYMLNPENVDILAQKGVNVTFSRSDTKVKDSNPVSQKTSATSWLANFFSINTNSSGIFSWFRNLFR